MASPPGSPSKSKENTQSIQTPLQQLQQRSAALQAKVREYQMQVLSHSRKGPEGLLNLSGYTLKLQNARTEAEKVERQLAELLQPITPVAGPSSHPLPSYGLSVPAAATTARSPFAQQFTGQPSWPPGVGDLLGAFGPDEDSESGEASFVEDNPDGYEMMQSEFLHKQVMHNIPGRHVKATITEYVH